MSMNPEKVIITSEKAPKALGPYSVATKYGNLVFTSGQLGLDPQTGNLVSGGIEAETRQALTNIKNVLESAGSSLDKVLKSTLYIRDINDFSRINAIYGEFFPTNSPARSVTQVCALPKGGLIEIEVIAGL